jgi:hypothetical protein
MRMKKLIVSILLVCAASVGYAEDKKPAAGAFDPEKFVVFLEKIMDTIATNKDDCTKMSTSLGKVIDDNKELLDQVRAHKPTDEQKKEMKAKYEGRVKSAVDKAKDGMMKCKDSAEFKTVMEKIPH